jgi:hypothetical protein
MNPLRRLRCLTLGLTCIAILTGSPGAAQNSCTQTGAMAERCLLLQQSAHAALGAATLAAAGGNPWTGTPSTLGRRTATAPRLGVQLRMLGARARLADRDGGAALEGRLLPALSAGFAVGVFDGFSPGTTVGGLLSLDLLTDIGTVLLPDGFDGSAFTWGAGARVGILRESFNLPGVTKSVQYRRLGDATYQVGTPGPNGFGWNDAAAWNLRLTAGKRVRGVGVSGGLGWDRATGDATVRTPGNGGPGFDSTAELETNRKSLFVGFGWTRLIWTFSAEAGVSWAGTDALEQLAEDPAAARVPFGALSLRLTF